MKITFCSLSVLFCPQYYNNFGKWKKSPFSACQIVNITITLEWKRRNMKWKSPSAACQPQDWSWPDLSPRQPVAPHIWEKRLKVAILSLRTHVIPGKQIKVANVIHKKTFYSSYLKKKIKSCNLLRKHFIRTILTWQRFLPSEAPFWQGRPPDYKKGN